LIFFFLFVYIESIKYDSANSHGEFRPRDISEVPPVTIRQTFMPSLRICFCPSDRDNSSRGLTLNRRFTNTQLSYFIKTEAQHVRSRDVFFHKSGEKNICGVLPNDFILYSSKRRGPYVKSHNGNKHAKIVF
jgi:hypothetical protein